MRNGMMRRVGILGGMGPEATILLMQKVLAAVAARDDADHIPLIVDQNPQVPSRIRHLIEGTGDDPGPVLAAMARRLVAAGAEALAMPCNTAHHYAPAIRAAVTVPFLDMVELSVAHAARLGRSGARPSASLPRPPCARSGLSMRALPRLGIDGALCRGRGRDAGRDPADQGRRRRDPRHDALRAASDDFLHRGAAVQMIACTEFSLIADAVVQGVEAFDTLDVLVDAIKAFAHRSVIRPPGGSDGPIHERPTKTHDNRGDDHDTQTEALAARRCRLGAACRARPWPKRSSSAISATRRRCSFCPRPTQLQKATGWDIEWRKFDVGHRRDRGHGLGRRACCRNLAPRRWPSAPARVSRSQLIAYSDVIGKAESLIAHERLGHRQASPI